jgi:hypothetical protein
MKGAGGKLFSITILPDSESPVKEEQTGIRLGEIRIDDFVETFEMSVSFWDSNDYLNHWKDALGRIVSGYHKSCLITSMHDPKNANFIVWWPIFREESVVIFQNQILFMNQLDTPFNPKDPFAHVGERKRVSESKYPISEWSVGLSAIEEFLKKIKPL